MHYPLVTIIGGSGFVGRHTVKLLAASGYRVRVLVRDTVAAEFLKTQATVGQIAIEHVDLTRPETLAEKFAGSDAVISLVSIAYETGRQKFAAINVDAARAIGAEARHAGVKRVIHISALGIEQAQETHYGATKLAGEAAMREHFPDATFLRPSLIIGPEDKFFQRFARMTLFSPILPLVGGGHTKFQPVLVTDVARAIAETLKQDATRGKTYEIAGPTAYSFRALLELMNGITKRRPCLVNLPAALAALQGHVCDMLPFPPVITRDQVRLLAHDNVVQLGALTLADLGITPTPIEEALPQLLARYVKV